MQTTIKDFQNHLDQLHARICGSDMVLVEQLDHQTSKTFESPVKNVSDHLSQQIMTLEFLLLG